MSVITLNHISKNFGNVTVVKEFTQEFKDGEFITLLGPSGCGKTTLLRIIAGFEKPTTGEVKIDGVTVSSDDVFIPPEKRGIGMVFQSYAVWPHMNVFDNIAYPLKIKKVPKSQVKQKVMEILEVVHLRQYAERMPSQLSGGQQQRVALGRALVAEPKLLLLDEPLSNLDAKLRESMRYEIKEIQKKLGITVVYVTHDQIEAMTMSDRVFVVNRGEIQQVGTPLEIYRHPKNQFVTDFVGKVNFIKGVVLQHQIYLSELEQSLSYDGDLKGNVVVAVRPENIKITQKGGHLNGILKSQFFLGDVNDCKIVINKTEIRVITVPQSYDILTPGQQVGLEIMSYLVFQDDGNEDYKKILT